VADVLVTLGLRAHLIAKAARQAGMKKASVVEFENADELVDWLKGHLASDDAVLIKGSHGLRMDKIVAALEVPQ
jgi:UDP-N-acetylmuramoyl-tripeptide--D-alanyl-D-alanine ligase